MKIVTFSNYADTKINIGEVSIRKVYGYRFDNGSKVARLLRKIDNGYRWIAMDGNTSENSFSFYGETETLAGAIKEVNTRYSDAVIYEFDNMNEFYKWTLGKE